MPGVAAVEEEVVVGEAEELGVMVAVVEEVVVLEEGEA